MKIGDITIQNQADVLPKPFISYFTRDISLGAGTQAITGVGFKPSAVIFMFGLGVSDYTSWGFDNLSSAHGIVHFNDTDIFAYTDHSISLLNSASGFEIVAKITTLGTDGFTITWTVISGSPTGTAVIGFKAYK